MLFVLVRFIFLPVRNIVSRNANVFKTRFCSWQHGHIAKIIMVNICECILASTFHLGQIKLKFSTQHICRIPEVKVCFYLLTCLAFCLLIHFFCCIFPAVFKVVLNYLNTAIGFNDFHTIQWVVCFMFVLWGDLKGLGVGCHFDTFTFRKAKEVTV